jgi:hypothetical protein
MSTLDAFLTLFMAAMIAASLAVASRTIAIHPWLRAGCALLLTGFLSGFAVALSELA